ncbi:MAG: ABC transporter permease [Acidobacteriota bacterium]
MHLIHLRQLRGWLVRLFGIFQRARREREFAEELESHLAFHIEDSLRAGVSPEEARRQALIKLGGVTLTQERYREQRGLPMLETLWQDLRFGLRMLRKNSGFTAVAVLTLALGIGANTAIFSVVNALVLNPLPYPDAWRLMWVTSAFRGNEIIGTDLYLTVQAQSRTFEHLAAYVASTITLTEQGEPERINSVKATASVFSTLGVTPHLGRAFTPEEDIPGAPRVIVLSHEYWQRRFGGNPSAIGQSLTFGKEQWTVIGVMPPGFRFLPEKRIGGRVDVLMPFAMDVQRELGAGGRSRIIEGGVFGRLRAEVSREQAQAELSLIFQRYTQVHPEMPPGMEVRVKPLAERLVGHLRRGLLVLFGSVGLVLLIACANVANLLLARAGGRQKELAIRAAMGAGRKRLIRQMLTESLMLSVLGGVAGLLLALWGVKALVAFTPENFLLFKLSSIDAIVLGFTFFATLLTGIVAGLIPALQASRIDLNESLKDGARSTSFFRRKSTAPALVVGELALTLVVLIGAGLLVRSFARMRAVDPGYNADHLLTMIISPSVARYPFGSAQRKQFNQALLARLSDLPGVQAVANSHALPLADDGIINKARLTVEGGPPVAAEQKPVAETHDISPEYFRALGMKLRAGRSFTEQDTENTPRVIVINESLAQRLYAGADPVGQRVRIERDKTEATIVGVVADVKWYGVEAEPPAAVYHSFFQDQGAEGMRWAIRTTGDPLALLPAVRQQVRELEPDHAIYQVTTMEQGLAESYAPRHFQTWLFGLFAAVALALAAVGLYGVISYAVSRRTHEIGIRVALGAQSRDVLLIVIRQGMSLALTGVAIGLAAALWLTRLMKGLLFGVRPADPLTFGVIALLLLGIALLACYVPARRATKVDPVIALRCD